MSPRRVRKTKSLYKKGGTKQDKLPEKVFKFNSRVVFIVVFFFGVALIAQMGRWQVLNHEKYVALANSQYLSTKKHPSGRGNIYGADGSILATDRPAWNVYASLSSYSDERETFFNDKESFVRSVSEILGNDPNQLEAKLTDDFRFVLIEDGITPDQKKALEETEIFAGASKGFGLYFEKSEKRFYPNNALASHILGYMGKDINGKDIGLYGIEGYYFGDLLGTEGYTYEEQDAYKNVILTTQYEPILPREGKDITLTIVPGIQKKVEEKLRKGVESHQGKSGSAIVMNPKTGEILAMANYPTYNPNEYWRQQETWVFKNKAIADVYEPGSVFKPITVAIGLETGAINKNTQCNDATGFITIYEGTPDEKKIYTWDKKPDGIITPSEYLQLSNNPCIAKTAMAVGHEKYYPMMREFGIGDFVGLGLQDETNSYVRPYEEWLEIDLVVTSFGQSISATPMQMISAISAIANDGKRMQPYVVKEVASDDEVIKFVPKVASQPISEKTADDVARMMTSVVTGGDAKWIFDKYLRDYDIAGKTGTAQIPLPDRAGYYTDRTNATFIGFAPVDDPKMIMLIRIEEPSLNTYAASTAVPVWVDTFLAIADDLEVPKK